MIPHGHKEDDIDLCCDAVVVLLKAAGKVAVLVALAPVVTLVSLTLTYWLLAFIRWLVPE